jgi:diguanylate cyclase (GGDEF)-like protein
VKVLVVDDTALTRAAVRDMLEGLGHEYLGAPSAEEGLARYGATRPHVVLSDWVLPERDGLWLCRQIRGSAGRRYPFVVIQTSLSPEERPVEAMLAGADAFLEKPVRLDRLAAVLVAAERITSLYAQLAESERRSRWLAEEQAALARVATSIAAGADVWSLCADSAREAVGLVGGSSAAAWRLDGEEATVMGSCGPSAPPLGLVVRPSPASALGQLTAGRDRVVVAVPGPGAPGRTSVGAGVDVNGQPWGAIVATVEGPRPVAPSARDCLRRLAELVGIGIASVETRIRLQEQAATDPLTGLANRRTFRERLEAEAAQALRRGSALALVALDIDHFKRINDTYGHPMGDRVLVEVGRRVSRTAGREHLVARVGGEEFAWILPGVAGAAAVTWAERARAAVAGTPVEGAGHVTVSAGVCDLEAAGGSTETLVRLADEALYAAKQGGRDRCVLRAALQEASPAAVRAGPACA